MDRYASLVIVGLFFAVMFGVGSYSAWSNKAYRTIDGRPIAQTDSPKHYGGWFAIMVAFTIFGAVLVGWGAVGVVERL